VRVLCEPPRGAAAPGRGDRRTARGRDIDPEDPRGQHGRARDVRDCPERAARVRDLLRGHVLARSGRGRADSARVDRGDARLCVERERAARQDRRGADPAPGARRGSRAPGAAPDRGETSARPVAGVLISGPPCVAPSRPDVTPEVTELRALPREAVLDCVSRYGARLVLVPDGEPIPYSYWGAPEAGLEGNRVYVRGDTPAHSLLHELGHYVCMSPDRRRGLVKDAGGTALEECAVCYLQVLLADWLPGFGRDKALADM